MNPLAVAISVAREAAMLLLERRGTALEISEKGARGDLVTSADRAAEALIVARLQAASPRSTVLGEEGGTRPGAADERWIVDPLDGTTNYAHGYPMYCVSIAYELRGEVVAAAIEAPAVGLSYAAERGAGATCNGRPIRVSHIPTLGDAMVCTGFAPSNYDRNGTYFAALSRRAQAVRRDGSAALDLAFVADGRFEAFWEFDLRPWDVAAGALLVREAGGHVTAIDGTTFEVSGRSVLATNAHVHAAMLAALVPESLGSAAGIDRDDLAAHEGGGGR